MQLLRLLNSAIGFSRGCARFFKTHASAQKFIFQQHKMRGIS